MIASIENPETKLERQILNDFAKACKVVNEIAHEQWIIGANCFHAGDEFERGEPRHPQLYVTITERADYREVDRALRAFVLRFYDDTGLVIQLRLPRAYRAFTDDDQRLMLDLPRSMREGSFRWDMHPSKEWVWPRLSARAQALFHRLAHPRFELYEALPGMKIKLFSVSDYILVKLALPRL